MKDLAESWKGAEAISYCAFYALLCIPQWQEGSASVRAGVCWCFFVVKRKLVNKFSRNARMRVPGMEGVGHIVNWHTRKCSNCHYFEERLLSCVHLISLWLNRGAKCDDGG